MTEKRLYIDMDGTLAQFRPVEKVEELLEPGYFLNLEPNMQLINAVRNLFEGSFFDGMYILSAIPRKSVFAKTEKMKWLQTYLPEFDEEHMLFPFCDEPKSFAVDENSIFPKSFFLLDDYNKNLYDWMSRGGTAIKFLNGVNNSSKKWTGAVVSNTENCLEELFMATV